MNVVPHPAIRPRSLANVLLDLKEARRDWEQALADAEAAATPMDGPLSQEEIDAGDRMSEADTRIEDLREEFAERFLEATGLTWKQIEDAVAEAVL
jgi:hypothetical protein